MGLRGVITYTHEFFKSCWYYLSSHLNPPSYLKQEKQASKSQPSSKLPWKSSFQESDTTWAGQEGG